MTTPNARGAIPAKAQHRITEAALWLAQKAEAKPLNLEKMATAIGVPLENLLLVAEILTTCELAATVDNVTTWIGTPCPAGVQWRWPKANPLFGPEMTVLIRFVKYSKPEPCALCGKKRRNHWTMAKPFNACDTGKVTFTLDFPLISFLPWAPMCDDHILRPAFGPFVKEEGAEG